MLTDTFKVHIHPGLTVTVSPPPWGTPPDQYSLAGVTRGPATQHNATLVSSFACDLNASVERVEGGRCGEW